MRPSSKLEMMVGAPEQSVDGVSFVGGVPQANLRSVGDRPGT